MVGDVRSLSRYVQWFDFSTIQFVPVDCSEECVLLDILMATQSISKTIFRCSLK